MKKLQLLQISASVVAFGAMVALLATVNAHDAMAAETSATGNAKAKIIAPVTLEAVSGTANELNFGTMLSSSAHNVTVSTAGVRTGTVANMLVSDSNTPSAGKFTASSDTAISTTLAIDSTATISHGSTNLTVNSLTTDPATGTLALTAGTPQEIKVGGTLVVPQNAESGDYTGTYHVTLSY